MVTLDLKSLFILHYFIKSEVMQHQVYIIVSQYLLVRYDQPVHGIDVYFDSERCLLWLPSVGL